MTDETNTSTTATPDTAASDAGITAAPVTSNPAPDPTLGQPGTQASDTSEATTGAESTYVHGDQRIAENPAPSGAPDVSAPVDQVLREMHVDSKLSSGDTAPVAAGTPLPTTAQASLPVTGSLPADPQAPVTTSPTISPNASAPASGMVNKNAQGEPVDQYGRTQADLDELAKKREEASKVLAEQTAARQNHAQAVADNNAAARDRSMAVQEEVGTRERDGATIGTPAFERRKATVAAILDKTTPANDPSADNRPYHERLSELAASLHTASPSGLETLQHQIMALAAEMHGDSKPASGTTPAPQSDQNKSVAAA